MNVDINRLTGAVRAELTRQQQIRYFDDRHSGPYDTIGTPRPKPFARDQYEIELDEVFDAMRRSGQHLAMYERPR
jgi:hypothetical protein